MHERWDPRGGYQFKGWVDGPETRDRDGGLISTRSGNDEYGADGTYRGSWYGNRFYDAGGDYRGERYDRGGHEGFWDYQAQECVEEFWDPS